MVERPPLPIADLRQPYQRATLLESEMSSDPLVQFQAWFAEAIAAEIPEPNAMTLSTVSVEGKPSARIVLLKGIENGGFVFYTNYRSRKGQELAQTPYAALTFLWLPLERQVRIEGRVDPVDPVVSDAYFQSRPRGSQLGAWASDQSSVVRDRATLELELQRLEEQFGSGPIPRPDHWGGFQVFPTWVEFWQGRPNRLHDRLCYRQGQQGWSLERLAP
jgi:pyridoxamine 5'-phosphate oxidase